MANDILSTLKRAGERTDRLSQVGPRCSWHLAGEGLKFNIVDTRKVVTKRLSWIEMESLQFPDSALIQIENEAYAEIEHA